MNERAEPMGENSNRIICTEHHICECQAKELLRAKNQIRRLKQERDDLSMYVRALKDEANAMGQSYDQAAAALRLACQERDMWIREAEVKNETLAILRMKAEGSSRLESA